MLRLALPVLCLFALTAFAACDGDDPDQPTPAASPTAGTQISGDLTVFAAASLTDAFEQAKAAFEDANPDVSITFNFAGSPALRTQLAEGARADIYASADTSNMQQALDAGLVVDAGDVFARNRLAVIIPSNNPGGIAALQDLANSGLKLVLAAEDVPVGRYARQSIAKMDAEGSFGEDFAGRVLANIVSNEPNVKSVVTKVQLGEADAGIVYVTDVTGDVAADVSMIEIPEALNVIASYPIAITAESANVPAAEAFIAFLLSTNGQAILQEHGFLPIE